MFADQLFQRFAHICQSTVFELEEECVSVAVLVILHSKKRHRIRDGKSSKAVDPEEMEANRFAAELLMPTEFLVRDIEDLENFDPESVVALLARRYKVSPQAMRIRLGNFGFMPAD